jgi:XTP/dITP diphosphohydrolase
MGADFRLKKGDSLVVATHNMGKLREFRDLFEPLGVGVLSSGELGVEEPEETGDTFEENARLKAVATAEATGRLALADDSGLAVASLGGAPGVHSARWAGEPRDFHRAMARVEDELKALNASAREDRAAEFVCVLCLANPSGAVQFFKGTAPGHLVWPPRGTKGFGYDPIFVPEGYDVTFGEMDPAKKHAISHRAKAFAAFSAAVLAGDGDGR